MLRHILILSVIIFTASCEQKGNHTNSHTGIADSTAVLNDPKNNLNIQTRDFIQIDSSGILMFPLSMEEHKSSRSSYYKEVPWYQSWNIIFYNGHTGEYYLLDDRKMLIREHYIKQGNPERMQTKGAGGYIFYLVIAEDHNEDKKFTDADPTYLFVSDKEGKHFRQVSPAGYDLHTWEYVSSLNKVILTAKKDSDGNKEFDESDEITTFEVQIDSNVVTKEIFPTEFKNKLKLIYDRDWKRLKE